MFNLALIKDNADQICTARKIRDNIGYLLAVIILFGLSLSAVAASNVSFSKAYGGPGGAPFVDLVAPGGRISAITIRSGKFIDSIKVEYRHTHIVKGPLHGGSGGKAITFRLKKKEYIIEFGGKSGKVVDSIYVKTNTGRVMKWGGKGGGKSFRFTATKSTPITGIWGRSGGLVDAIGVIQKSTLTKGDKSATFGRLGSFKPDEQAPADCGDKCDSMNSKYFPRQPSNQQDKTFWIEHTNTLGSVLRALAGSERDYQNYLKQEKDLCSSYIPCQIDARGAAIGFVTGVK
ncbi:MAG: hypothetical protein ACJAXJ_004098 [Colwellia sp.]|jgi:hypothetical protein